MSPEEFKTLINKAKAITGMSQKQIAQHLSMHDTHLIAMKHGGRPVNENTAQRIQTLINEHQNQIKHAAEPPAQYHIKSTDLIDELKKDLAHFRSANDRLLSLLEKK
jgi:ribosome-binding protein aMBF1 (putative translation factor)